MSTPPFDLMFQIMRASFLGEVRVSRKSFRAAAIAELDPDTQSHLFFVIDNVIQNIRAKKAYA